MNEVTGGTLKFSMNAIEREITGLTFDDNYTMLDSTTTSTVSPGTESVTGRTKRTLKIDANVNTALGAEIATGTLTLGTKYLVTLGTVDGHTVGTIFTSDGTEECTAENKVKPLGAKLTGKTLAISIGGSTFAGISCDYSLKYTEYDSTTTATTAPGTSTVAGRHKITSKIEALMYRATADLITATSPTIVAVIITLDTGITITGNAILNQISITDEVNGIVAVSYNAEWQGVPTEVGIGDLTMATAQACAIIYETGTTNKAITGTLLLTGKTVTADSRGDTKISYDGVLNDAIVKTVYS